jgi:hypothetical protein
MGRNSGRVWSGSEALRSCAEALRSRAEALWSRAEALRNYAKALWNCAEAPRSRAEALWSCAKALRNGAEALRKRAEALRSRAEPRSNGPRPPRRSRRSHGNLRNAPVNHRRSPRHNPGSRGGCGMPDPRRVSSPGTFPGPGPNPNRADAVWINDALCRTQRPSRIHAVRPVPL